MGFICLYLGSDNADVCISSSHPDSLSITRKEMFLCDESFNPDLAVANSPNCVQEVCFLSID